MKQILFSFLAVCLWCVVHGETVLRHWDFEGDENGWTIVDQGRFSRFSQEAAFKGKSGLRIVDDTQDDGSNVISEPVPIK